MNVSMRPQKVFSTITRTRNKRTTIIRLQSTLKGNLQIKFFYCKFCEMFRRHNFNKKNHIFHEIYLVPTFYGKHHDSALFSVEFCVLISLCFYRFKSDSLKLIGFNIFSRFFSECFSTSFFCIFRCFLPFIKVIKTIHLHFAMLVSFICTSNS